jgi:hypothetical protein
MRALPIALIAAAVGLAACGALSLSGSPAGASPEPIPVIGGFAGETDAFVVTIGRAADNSGTDDLRVEAVSAEGRRVLAAFNVSAGYPLGTRIKVDSSILVSPRGLLTVAIEGGITGPSAAIEPDRRLVLDLRDVGRPPLIVPEGYASWGPDGRLAIQGVPGVTFVDPLTGDSVVGPLPEGIDLAMAWAADGSGLLASLLGADNAAIPGILRPDGTFLEGVREPYSSTGLGRLYGAEGLVLTANFPGDANGTDQAILQVRPDPQDPIVWLSVDQPSLERQILTFAYDAPGIGAWVLLGHDDQVDLVHLTGPNALERRATFTTRGRAWIRGVAPDDHAVVVATDVADPMRTSLLLVDTRTGAVTRLGGAGGFSSFAGWAAIR